MRAETRMLFPGSILKSAIIKKMPRSMTFVQLTNRGLWLKLRYDMKEAVMMRVIEMIAFKIYILLFY
jgi:hypothetical protein